MDKIKLAVFLIFALLMGDAMALTATVTPATGGGAIPSNTAPGCSATGWTTLSGPSVTELQKGDFQTGTIILNAPAGFVFDSAGVAPTVVLTAGDNNANKNVNNVAVNAVMPVTSVTSTQITFTITAKTNSTVMNSLSWQDVRVQPTTSAPQATGNITDSGSLAIVGGFGTLTEVASTPVCTATGGSAVTVTANPSLCVNDASIGVSTGSWAGLTNVGLQDLAYAQASVANSDITNYLKCTGYNFAIPTGATITGIRVSPWLNATWTMNDKAMQLVKGGAIQPTNLAVGTAIPNGGGVLAPTPTQFIYGSSTNLWGNTWTATDINSANFGAAFAAQRGGFATTQQAAVDAMPITIDYTLPATLPSPIAEYRMDESSWNGTTNEAVNTAAGTFYGTAAGLTTKPTTASVSPAIAGSPGTCRYGVFNRSNKDYLTLAGFPNLAAAAGNFTITAWINVANNTLPGQRIFIDDETNSSPGGWGFSVGETTAFGAGGLRFYYRQPSVYILDTVAIPSNQWLFVALSVRLVAGTNASSATIYAYNTTGTQVATNTGTFTWTAGSDPGPASIGGETNASGEGTNLFGFGGNLDEVRVYQSALTQAQVVAIAAETHACTIAAPHHLEIQHASGTGLTCAASTLTIKACADAACTTPYTGGVSGTLSATGTPTVNWDGTTGGATGAGFVIPSGSSSVTKNVQVATAGAVSFGIASPSPAPSNVTTCNFGAPTCTFTASSAGFVFSNSATGGTYTIPAQVSGIATPTLYLRALQASTTNPAVCTPAIIGQTTGVTMGYACNNPATCQAGSLTTINATAVAPAGTSVNLTFDANGSAPITARYDDVGQITLNASKTVTPFGGATAVTLNGSSNAFVVKPHHFDLSSIQQTAAPALANPAAANAAGAKFVKAGESFSVTVTARNFGNAVTPNYGKEIAAESVKLTSALVAPAGGNNPTVGGTFGAFASGVAAGTTFIWNEVGIITLTPSVADADYLGAGDVTGTASGNVGRFYAAQLAVSGGVIANRTGLGGVCVAPAGCGTFTYMGEQMSAVFNLTAKAADGSTTLQNYTTASGFAKFDPTATGNPLALAAVDSGAPRTVATLDTTTYGVASGSFSVTGATVTVPFSVTRGVSVSGPFEALDVGVNPVDSDGTTLSSLDLAVNVGGSPNTHGKIGSTKARYGWMKISNAHGSELLALPINVVAQYWDGASYIINALDNNSSFATTDVIFSNPLKNLVAGETSVVTPPASVVFNNGIASYKLAKPNGGDGKYDGSLDMTVSALSAYLPSNTARATFGVYKGNNEFIYLRENY